MIFVSDEQMTGRYYKLFSCDLISVHPNYHDVQDAIGVRKYVFIADKRNAVYLYMYKKLDEPLKTIKFSNMDVVRCLGYWQSQNSIVIGGANGLRRYINIDQGFKEVESLCGNSEKDNNDYISVEKFDEGE